MRHIPIERYGSVAALVPDGQLVAVGNHTGTITVFDLSSQRSRVLSGARGPVRALTFAADRLVSGGNDGVLRVWDPASGALLREAPTGAPITELAAVPGGRVVASSGIDGTITLHELIGEASPRRLTWHTAQVFALAWAGAVLLSGEADGRVALWEVTDGVR